MNPLLALEHYGQSYWLDNLTRAMISDGALHTRVSERGLRGVTSNPSIFQKAIAGSRDYDEQIERLLEEGGSTQEVYEALVTTDVRDACDILRPVYDRAKGLDGYVSAVTTPAYLPGGSRVSAGRSG